MKCDIKHDYLIDIILIGFKCESDCDDNKTKHLNNEQNKKREKKKKTGKLFEILVKHILVNIGFMEVNSDGLYVYDAAPGHIIQRLGETHHADVLLEPPVQIPFYAMSRILVKCKGYIKKVGLDVIRSAFGL